MSEIHVKRPINSFMIFARKYRPIIAQEKKITNNSQISQLLGNAWNKLSADQKQKYITMADMIKIQHMKEHPGYKYKPRLKRRISSKVSKKKVDNSHNITSKKSPRSYLHKTYEDNNAYKINNTTNDILLDMGTEIDYYEYMQSLYDMNIN